MAAHDLDSSNLRLLEVILAEYSDRCRRGEPAAVDEYLERHPQLADELRDALPAIRQLNRLAPKESGSHATKPAAETPQQIGEYQIVGEIGRGGMGIVYHAVQASLNRPVALKVLARPVGVNDNSRERFTREARYAAQLHHSNIVPVFGAGVAGDVQYYAMQYIEGECLDRVIGELREYEPYLDADYGWINSPPANDEPAAQAARRVIAGRLSSSAVDAASSALAAHRSPIEEKAHAERSPLGNCPTGYCASVARIGRQIALALAHAHAHGILHRDIKPSNLILDRQGTVWVTDFGLALATSEPGLTSAGDLVGTLRYLAPERFRGRVDAQSDIYSLGLVLYELLTFRSPFAGNDRQALMKSIFELEPPPPRKLRRGVPRDLETIVLKAIAKEPERRYATSAELAEDLERFLEGRPVQARPLSAWGRFWRWRRRNPVVAALAGLLLLVMLTSLPIVTWQWRRAEANLRRAVEMEQVARQQRDQAERNFIRARQAVDDYLTTISESSLLDIPTLEPVRAELLSRAREFYEGFVQYQFQDPQLQGELAATYIRLSQVMHDLQGDWLPVFEHGLTLLEQSQAAGVSLTDSRSWREGVYNARSGQLHVDEPDRLLPLLERAIAIWSELVARQPEVDGFAGDLAGLHMMRGLLHLDGQRQPSALDDFLRSLELRETLVERRPDAVKFQYALGESCAMLGIAYLRAEQWDLSWEYTHRARTLLSPLVKDNPSATRTADILAAIQQWLAQVRLNQGRPLEALTEFQLALEIRRRLAHEYPYVPQFQLQLCESYRLLSQTLFDAGQSALARGAVDDCCEFLEQRIAAYPDRAEYRQALVEQLIDASMRLSHLREHDEAESLARSAAEHVQAAHRGTPLAARALFRLGLTLLDQGRPGEAIEPLQSAVEIERAHDSPLQLAARLLILGNALERDANHECAANAYRETLSLYQTHGPASDRMIGVASLRLSAALERLGRADDAIAALRAALLAVRTAKPDEDPLVARLLGELIELHQQRADWKALEELLAEHRAHRSVQDGVVFGDAWSIRIEKAAGDAAPDATDEAVHSAPALELYFPNGWIDSSGGSLRLSAEATIALPVGAYQLRLLGSASGQLFVDGRPIWEIPAGATDRRLESTLNSDGQAKLFRIELDIPQRGGQFRFWICPREDAADSANLVSPAGK